MITGTLCLCDDFVTSLQDVLRRLKIGAGIQRPWCVMHPDMPLAEPRVGVGPGRLKVTSDPQQDGSGGQGGLPHLGLTHLLNTFQACAPCCTDKNLKPLVYDHTAYAGRLHKQEKLNLDHSGNASTMSRAADPSYPQDWELSSATTRPRSASPDAVATVIIARLCELCGIKETLVQEGWFPNFLQVASWQQAGSLPLSKCLVLMLDDLQRCA